MPVFRYPSPCTTLKRSKINHKMLHSYVRTDPVQPKERFVNSESVVYQHLSDEYQLFLGGGGSSFWRASAVGDLASCSGRLLVLGGLLLVAVRWFSCGIPAAAFFRASTTRRTITARWSVQCCHTSIKAGTTYAQMSPRYSPSPSHSSP